MIKIKRVYEPESKVDGYRVFVDLLWPRGLKKMDLKFDEWSKEISPSSELRKWFAHDPLKFKEFRMRYKKELKASLQQEKLKELADLARKKNVTLLYAAHDEKINHALILKEVLESMFRKPIKKPAKELVLNMKKSPLQERRAH